MVRLNKVLDPTLTGHDAADLESSLRRKIVGQDQAIEAVSSGLEASAAGTRANGERPLSPASQLKACW